MLNVNQHILGIFDTSPETLVTYTKSLENIASYSVTFHATIEEEAGFESKIITCRVKTVSQEVPVPSTGILPIVKLSEQALVPAGQTTVLWEGTCNLIDMPTAGLAMSDSGFGYKNITVEILIDVPTSIQFIVTAILHTTPLT